MQGSQPPSWNVCVELPPLPWEHQNLLLLPTWITILPWEETWGTLVLSVEAGHLSQKEWSGAEDTVGDQQWAGWKYTAPPRGFSQIKKRRIIKPQCCGELGKSFSFFDVLTHSVFAFLTDSTLSIRGQWQQTQMQECEIRGRRGEAAPPVLEPVPPKKVSNQTEGKLMESLAITLQHHYGGTCLALSCVVWRWPIKYGNKDNSHLFYITRLSICVVNSVITSPKLHASFHIAWLGENHTGLIFKGRIFQIFHYTSDKHELGHTTDTQQYA